MDSLFRWLDGIPWWGLVLGSFAAGALAGFVTLRVRGMPPRHAR